MDFEKQVILENILEEAKVLTNKRGVIDVDGEKRVIYAYYLCRGEKDPELKYDRKKHPELTNPNSTLCEIYSVFGKEDEKLGKEKKLKKGQLFYQGPWIGDFNNPAENARLGIDQYYFTHSASNFIQHFNDICFREGYNFRLSDIDANSLKVKGSGKIELNGKFFVGNMLLVRPLNINLRNKDPSLSEVLDDIENTYDAILNADLSSVKILV
jgi:hypothetical protein